MVPNPKSTCLQSLFLLHVIKLGCVCVGGGGHEEEKQQSPVNHVSISHEQGMLLPALEPLQSGS